MLLFVIGHCFKFWRIFSFYNLPFFKSLLLPQFCWDLYQILREGILSGLLFGMCFFWRLISFFFFLNFGEYFRFIWIKRSILAFSIYILSCQNVNLCLERVEYGCEVHGNLCLPLRVMHAEAGLAVSGQPYTCVFQFFSNLKYEDGSLILQSYSLGNYIYMYIYKWFPSSKWD